MRKCDSEQRVDGLGTTEFTQDGEDILLNDSSVSGTKTYQNGPGIDNRLSVKAGTSISYLLADHLGSTDALTDATGAITAAQTYDSFGNASNGSFPSRYQFTGRESDPTIGLQFSRARFYDPKLGRFISEDPIGFAGGDINIYGYVSNRPIALRDPTGQHGTIGLGTAAGMAFLIATSASPVNAPSRCDPVYFPDNPLLANAAMGQALGMAGGYLYGRFVSPYVGRLIAGMGDDIITLGIPRPQAAPPAAPPVRPTAFLGQESGPAIPIPQGSAPIPIYNPAGKMTGFGYTGGSGGNGLSSRVASVRIMDPTLPRGPSPGYPNGYVNYMNASGQAIHPYTGQTVAKSSQWWHLPLGE